AKALFNAAQTPVVRVRSPYSEEPAYGGFFAFWVRTLHRTAFDYSAKGLILWASAKALFNAAQTPVVRVRSPYLEEPAQTAGFCFSGPGLSIELRSIIRPLVSSAEPAQSVPVRKI
ncbi:hypothetical protein, partial [Serratia sarumanii]|uniref:hypothetical protein n=1 Tax=Serratia sarumanii TaxID=3020826 RepID=UPI003F7E21BA